MNNTEKVVIAGAAALVLFKLLDDAKATGLDLYFRRHGEANEIDWQLLKALAKKESQFNPNAVHVNSNKSVDYGLMQVNDRTFAHYGIGSNFYDVEVNVSTAARLLGDLKKELGTKFSIFTWISAYNLGSPSVKKNGITNPGYVGEVYLYYSLYKLS